jgi:hypothetical protein
MAQDRFGTSAVGCANFFHANCCDASATALGARQNAKKEHGGLARDGALWFPGTPLY